MRPQGNGSKEQSSGFTLVRVEQSGAEEVVATPASFEEGWSEGQRLTHAEPRMAFSLYRPNGSRAARFCHHRLTTNDATVNLDAMVL